MKKILITGFEPFDGDLINPTMVLLDFLKTHHPNNQHRFLTLPVTFSNSFEVLRKNIDEFQPDFILMTGFAKTRKLISLEKVGINWIDPRIPDNDGVLLPVQRIMDNNIDAIFTNLDLEKLILNMGINSFEISYSAGTYVCNFVYYNSLLKYKIPQLFIHIPGLSNFTNQEIFNSVNDLLDSLNF